MIRAHISRIHAPVTTLGPGRRLGIWFQGCSIGCRGCISKDTWDTTGGRSGPVSEVIDYAKDRIAALALTGVTISGGEPFEQPDALRELLVGLRAMRVEPEVDILCYSGLPRRKILTGFPEHVALLDALIPEPFVRRRGETAQWRGSANQPLMLLSDLAQRRFDAPPEGPDGMQVAVTENRIWFIGVPRSADMERLARGAEDRGLVLEDVSWLA